MRIVYTYDFQVGRARYRGTIPPEEARTKAQAEDYEARKRIEVTEGRYRKPTGQHVLSEYADRIFVDWSKDNKKSADDDVYHVATIKEFFEHKTFGEISPMDVERFKRQRRQGLTKKGTQRSPASVNRELACLSRIFSLAIRDGFAASNPCAQVKKLRENNKRQRYLDAEEETRLFAACTGQRAHLKPILMIALQTGMRKGEILSLRWSQIDFARGVIHLPDPKSGKEEEVTINERVREELLELRVESEGSEFVFRSPKTGRALTEVKRAFKAACLEAGISGLRFHDTRHTIGTRLAATGTDPVTIASILRHADLRMTARYTHAIAERKRQALERISTFAERAAERQKNVKTDERRKA